MMRYIMFLGLSACSLIGEGPSFAIADQLPERPNEYVVGSPSAMLGHLDDHVWADCSGDDHVLTGGCFYMHGDVQETRSGMRHADRQAYGCDTRSATPGSVRAYAVCTRDLEASTMGADR